MTLDKTASRVRTEAPRRAGYTLVELIVAIGFFTLIMTLASGAYLVMINTNRQAQGIANGINNLSFAIETMMYNIRTGTGYVCGTGDCPNGESSFSFTDADGNSVIYDLSVPAIQQTKNGTVSPLTDSSVEVSLLTFYVTGTGKPQALDYNQPYVTIVVHGTVSVGPGKPPQPFTIETGAAMRGTDL